MEHPEFMPLPLKIIPTEIIDKYNLRKKAEGKGWVYVQIKLGMYGLPQAGLLVNKLLAKRLHLVGYYHYQYTPGLWRHVWHPITFSLVVDNFVTKTVGLTHAKPLKQALEKYYKVDVDCKGQLYCGIHLDWTTNTQLLDNAATYPNPSIWYCVSDMILALDTDSSYLSEPEGKSRAAAYFYLTKQNKPDFHNGTDLALSAIIKHIMASASETELAALFYNCKGAIPLRMTLEEKGHPQPGPTPVTTDNSAAIGLTLNNMTPKASKSMDMRLQWLEYQRAQSLFCYLWAKGVKNRADYPSKHHSASHHQCIRSSYVTDGVLPQ
eukprot:CCRYP_010895-RA/>CCRYP_010895-RA protein AED:0.39 eAED:0.39 QI:0/0/0/1/1/1/2/0/321